MSQLFPDPLLHEEGLPCGASIWLQNLGVGERRSLSPVPGDASARRYWRLGQNLLLAHVPDGEEILPFLRVAYRFARVGLPVPRIHAASVAHGFMLLEDLGREDLKSCLDNADNADVQLHKAMELILKLQTAGRGCNTRPFFSAYGADLLHREMQLFPHWYLRCHLGLKIDLSVQGMLEGLFAGLADSALRQPKVWVHRDFHARNLLFLPSRDALAMIDFQDAVSGPWTYDLASLLWDRYWDWGKGRRDTWISWFHNGLERLGAKPPAPSDFQLQVWRMALQRNLKILGIFSRLAYRDGRTSYLDLLPRFWGYLMEGLENDPQWDGLQKRFLAWAPSGRP